MKPRTIYDNLNLEAGTSGYLDWATGVSRINASISEWEEFCNRPVDQLTPRERKLAEAAAHEHVHFAQITTTGYLYRFAALLYDLLLRCVPETTFTVPGPDLKPPPEVASQFATLLNALDQGGPSELTTRTIIESQAFYMQKRSTLQGLDHGYYLNMLDKDMPGPEYRRAYDLAAERLGPRAFGTFPALASVALCTHNPADSFFKLAEAAAMRRLYYTRATGIMPFVDLASEVATDWLGVPVDLVERLPQHPVYTPVVFKINELCMQGSQSPLTFLTALYKAKGKLVSATLRPLIFNRIHDSRQTPLHLPSGLWIDKTPEEKDNEGHNLIVIAAISASFLGNIDLPQ